MAETPITSEALSNLLIRFLCRTASTLADLRRPYLLSSLSARVAPRRGAGGRLRSFLANKDIPSCYTEPQGMDSQSILLWLGAEGRRHTSSRECSNFVTAQNVTGAGLGTRADQRVGKGDE